MSANPIYRTAIAPEWVDYNGHLRDAYYALVISFATDALMDRLGLDAAYRERTRCTLYTLEAHFHFLREVKQSDVAEVSVRILGADAKRIHAGFELRCAGVAAVAAVAELMLLHVQQGQTVTALPFPSAVIAAIARLREETDRTPADGPGSRRMQLRPPATHAPPCAEPTQ
jgi:acyl-CoA thioester hydrolase